jgi:Tfp pilus assembly protein PilF
MWDRSLKVFTTMLLHQNNIESAEQRVEIFYHLGVLRLKTDDARKAKDMFNRALGIDPDHAPSRAALESL